MLKTKQLVSQPASRKLSWKSMFRMPEPSVTLSTVNTLTIKQPQVYSYMYNCQFYHVTS